MMKRAASDELCVGRGDGHSKPRQDASDIQQQQPILERLLDAETLPSSSIQGGYDRYRWLKSTKRSARLLSDHDHILYAINRVVFPNATPQEIDAFSSRVNFNDMKFRLCRRSLTKGRMRIRITSAKKNVRMNPALLHGNQPKNWVYWNLPYPFGIADLRRQDLIDLDDCCIELLSRCSHNTSWRNGTMGHEKSTKSNFLFAISGDGDHPRRWSTWTGNIGPWQKRLALVDFVQMILDQIGPGTEQRRYCFIMDRSNFHDFVQVYNIIYSAGHRISIRAPFQPNDGPIEYVLNSIQETLKEQMNRITDKQTLRNEFERALSSIPSFEKHFIDCGYWRHT